MEGAVPGKPLKKFYGWFPGRNECLGKFVYVYKGMNVLKLDRICMKSCSTLYATSVVHF